MGQLEATDEGTTVEMHPRNCCAAYNWLGSDVTPCFTYCAPLPARRQEAKAEQAKGRGRHGRMADYALGIVRILLQPTSRGVAQEACIGCGEGCDAARCGLFSGPQH
ncbi:hypothetical protein VTL71DRAFT_5400 [Oculimacula yallundae]|uniref:Uncharacterized protein n=1 Tax=Oculimacula yallundae TaxID=86028 RepID=A0ABR4C1L8_9HELO